MKEKRILKTVVKIAGFVAATCFAVAAVFALWYLIEFYPRTARSFEINSRELPTRILVASQGSEFKNGLVAAVCDLLEPLPVYVKVIDVGGLDDIDTAEWDKILVINTAMMNRMSGPARRLVERDEDLNNVLLLVTSGGADFNPAGLEVDALSGASRLEDTHRLADLILDWTDGDSEGRWTAGNQVLALEYFHQVDAGAACAAIHSDQRRYQQLYPDLQRRLNKAGYDFMRRGLLADALHAFRLNRDLFPESWNVYDSYAEALLANGDREEAVANYRKAVELNPSRDAGRQRLAALEPRT